MEEVTPRSHSRLARNKQSSLAIGRQSIRRREIMHVEQQSRGRVIDRLVGERRTGIDRRRLTYDWIIPERRGLPDRRQGSNAQSGNHTA